MSVVLKGGTLYSNKICGILRFEQVKIYLLWLSVGIEMGLIDTFPHASSPSSLMVFLRNPRCSQSRVYLRRQISKHSGDPESK